MMVDKITIEKFKLYLIEELVTEYNMNELEAQLALAKSSVGKMLKVSPEFILHYSIKDNALDVYNEHIGIPMEM